MMRYYAQKFGFGRKLPWAAIGVVALAGSVLFVLENTTAIRAQSAQTAAAPLPSFEVATIKKSRAGDPPWGPNFRPGKFIERAQTINLVISLAYNVYPLKIFGAPSWVSSERYDIQAKESDATAEELRNLPRAKAMEEQALLLQSLLADRFGLKVSHQTRELPVYALVVAKSGPKLHQVMPDDKRPHVQLGAGQLTFRACPMASVVTVMSNVMHRTVLDQTGLKGNYDFTVQWNRNQTMSGMPREPGGGSPASDAASLDSSGPSFFTALREQLGLKLESKKAPVDVIVIDHIERPTEN